MASGLKAQLASAASNLKGCIRASIELLRNHIVLIRGFPRITRTLFLRLTGRTDYERWKNPENLEAWWETRTQLIAALIPKGKRVIEFGAGKRWLESYLDSSCSYVPSDLVDRGPGTIICDLNKRPLPDLKLLRPDVAVFIGVLEYVKDLPTITRWLSQQVSICVVSYVYASTEPGTLLRIVESLRRSQFGYVNTHTEPEFVKLFARSGFTCTRIEVWNEQRLFQFQNMGGLPLENSPHPSASRAPLA